MKGWTPGKTLAGGSARDMASPRNSNCHSVRLLLVVGMMLGATLATIFTIFIWFLSPAHGTVMVPRVMSSSPLVLDVRGRQLGQLMKEVREGERCVCRQGSGSALESKDGGAMDGRVSSSFQGTAQTSSWHYLDVTSPQAHTRQTLLAGAEQDTELMSGADTPKEVKQGGELKQQLMAVNAGDERERWVFRSLKEGKGMRETLVMAVIIGGTQLEWAKSVNATWGHNISHLVFYTDSQSNISIQEARSLGLQVVKLNVSTNMHTRLAILQHLSEHYGKSHHWFVVVTEDTYVHMDQLEVVLGRLSPEEPLLLGLPPHCQVRGRHKWSSTVLNQALLALLTRQLHLCLNENMEVAGSHGSAEIEACVSEHLNVHCSIPSSMQAYFVEVEESQTSISAKLLQSQEKLFSFLLTYSPLHQTKDMYILHHYYKKAQLMAAVEKTKHLQQEVKEVCTSLGPSFSSAKNCNPTLLGPVGHSHPRPPSKCPPNGVILTKSQPLHPKSIFDYFSWQYFDSKTIYCDQRSYPNYNLTLKKDVEKELDLVLSEVIQITAKKFGKHIKFKKLVNGWVRYDPIVGSEYIVDALFTDKEAVLSKRVHLVRPLARNYISLKDELVNSITVNIVVPFSGVSQKLTKFMSMYESLVFIPRKNVNLVWAVYGHEDVVKVNTILAQYRVKYLDANVMVVEGKGEFSRSKALHLGMSQLLPNDLAFMCDVDMDISPSFLDRCRSNAVQSSRVYFPEVFKEYNLDFVNWNRNNTKHSRISRETGHWAYYSFGMLCIYKSDYDSVGGMDTNITGWGGEDVSFFQNILEKGLQVMRAPDVGLIHQWHPKDCAKTLSTKQYELCQSSKEEDLADKRELARFVYGKLNQQKETTAGDATTTGAAGAAATTGAAGAAATTGAAGAATTTGAAGAATTTGAAGAATTTGAAGAATTTSAAVSQAR